MSQTSSHSGRRKPFDLPMDEGLAEWTSKIKAIQRQVDADEEAEQKRLAEEIAASRLARQRRSRGIVYAGQVANTNQLRRTDHTMDNRASEHSDDPISLANRHKRQDEALNQLTGIAINDTYPGTSSGSLSTGKSPPAPPVQMRSPSLPIEKKPPQPMSLAAFMGGRATGPRLNRHAPQQDALDPTQFDQRTHTGAPHPVFGKGGIAMPGMTKSSPSVDTNSLPDKVNKPSWSNPKRSSGVENDTALTSPPFLSHHTERLRAPSDATPPARRERTMSTPNRGTLAPSYLQTTSQDDRGTRDTFRRPLSYTPLPPSAVKSAEIPSKTPELRSKTSEGRLRGKLDLPPRTPENPPRMVPIRSTDIRRDSIDDEPPAASITFPPNTVSSSNRASHKFSVQPPSLARPIQPDVRVSPQGPSIPSSQSPSPAFLRPPALKDLTPSLSRLQGRGFVQSMVKVSSQIESTTTGSSSSPTSGDKARLSNAKKPSVLERWPTASMTQSVNSPSTTAVPPATPTPVARPIPFPKPSPQQPTSFSRKESAPPDFRKSLNPVSSLPSSSNADRPVPSSKPLMIKKRKSFTEQMPPEGSPGLGSSSTLISYLKPLKTGDDPLVLPDSTPSLEVDELGVKAGTPGAKPDYSVAKPVAAWDRSVPAGKPLSHPTKDRARKPRKIKDGQDNPVESRNEETDTRIDYVATYTENRREETLLPPTHLPSASLWGSSFPEDSRTPNPEGGSLNDGNIGEQWADRPLIGVKTVLSPLDSKQILSEEATPARNSMIGRLALPGLASQDAHTMKPANRQPPPRFLPTNRSEFLTMPESPVPAVVSPTRRLFDAGVASVVDVVDTEQFASVSSVTSNSPGISILASPVITARHMRGASPIHRTTAMDVAQALNDRLHSPSSPGWMEHRVDSSICDEAPLHPNSSMVEESTKQVGNRRPNMSSALLAEKRKSSYEKYSAIMLPPLKEEATPVASPAGTLTRAAVPPIQDIENRESVDDELAKRPEQVSRADVVDKKDEVVYFHHVDKPLPEVDIASLVQYDSNSLGSDTDAMTVSVEVMAITSSTATTLKRDTAIFYDSEALAIIHRSKSKSSGLVSTSVFGWWGRRRQVNEKEQRKLQDLAKRYGTVLETVVQGSEPLELVKILGGQLAIRQGTRTHWTSENTAMHLVRQSRNMMLIDEHDLNVKSLCSGFSYCISILQTIYIWHGRGSTPREQQAAMAYGRAIAPNEDSIIQLTEGETDNDEMFWMILGDDDYARADYWKWRPSATEIDPRTWRVGIENGRATISMIPSLSRETDFQTCVYVVDCIWEFFVLVAKDARGKRPEIQLAISVATRLSTHVAESRPYRPTVHVLVLPSQLPLEFRLNFRDIDEALLNDGAVPEHMNLLSGDDAVAHLRKTHWSRDALKDDTMLPLGLHSSDI